MRRSLAGGIVCLAIAAFATVIAVVMISKADHPVWTDPAGQGVSQAVGNFLPSVAMLILGVWLLQKRGEAKA